MYMQSIPVLIALALGALAQDDVDAAVKSTACTTTTTVRNQCCPAKSAYTSYTSVDCHGCSSIATRSTGPVCDIVCPTPTHVVDSTTTVAVCATSTSSACTITKTQPIQFGCEVTAAASTVTALTDCHGCALTTSFDNPFGHGPVCISGRKTVTDATSTTTVTSCAPTY